MLVYLNRHVSHQDKVDKLYRPAKQTPVFSLDGDDDDKHDSSQLVDIESFFLRSDLLYKYECDHIDENNRRHPR